MQGKMQSEGAEPGQWEKGPGKRAGSIFHISAFA